MLFGQMFKPVTYYFDRPITGTVRDGEIASDFRITTATFHFLRPGQTPPEDGLVFSCHHSLRDENGECIPVEVLALLDLERGIREAFHEFFGDAWEVVRGG